MLLLVGFAAVRVAAFTLIYHGLLGIGVSLDNPIGDDPADLPALAYQVWMKKECESFSAAIVMYRFPVLVVSKWLSMGLQACTTWSDYRFSVWSSRSDGCQSCSPFDVQWGST